MAEVGLGTPSLAPESDALPLSQWAPLRTKRAFCSGSTPFPAHLLQALLHLQLSCLKIMQLHSFTLVHEIDGHVCVAAKLLLCIIFLPIVIPYQTAHYIILTLYLQNLHLFQSLSFLTLGLGQMSPNGQGSIHPSA